jgi:ABC-2 type transport system permease protein
MNLRRLWAIARKEAIHIRRDPRSLLLAVGIPVLMIVLFGYALTLDVDRVPFVVWDQSGTPASRELIARLDGSRYLELQRLVHGQAEVDDAIARRQAVLALVIEARFAEDLGARRPARVLAILDGADSNTAAIVLGYTQGVAARFEQQVLLERVMRQGGRSPDLAIDLRARVWFNPDLESKNYIVPGIGAVILGLIAALLTSLTVAREWERGTMEQLISTPVRPAELILGKLLPYLVIGMVDVLIAVGMAVYLFEVPLRGSVVLLFASAALFIVGTLGQGILISTVARGQLLASQLAMASTFLPAFLLSGFMFAIANMPVPVQVITHIVPARYFVAIVNGIYLRGVGLETLWRETLFLGIFAVLIVALAITRFKKRLS